MPNTLTMKNTKKAVTLIELLVVIGLVAIVASTSFATYTRLSEQHRMKRAVNFLLSILNAARTYEIQHPPSLTVVLTDSDWEANWQDYLKNYLGPIPETSETKPDPSLLRTEGGNPVEYYMSTDSVTSMRRFYAHDINSNRVESVDWNGNLAQASGKVPPKFTSPVDECTNQHLCDNGCLTATCSETGSCILPVAKPNGASCGSGSICFNSTCRHFDLGDMNMDGVVNGDDLTILAEVLVDIGAYLSSHHLTMADLVVIADVNHDGSVTEADLEMLNI